MLCLKEGIDPACLRAYGFKQGKELAAEGVPGFQGVGYSWKHEMWFKLHENPDEGGYMFMDGFDDIAQGTLYISGNGELSLDVAPSCSYHIDSWDFQDLLDTIGQLCIDGFIEYVEVN